MSDAEHKNKIERQFGRAADGYATSEIHAHGESLQHLLELTHPQIDWQMLDVATGAGHTAIAFAPHVQHVIASDLTDAMLRKTMELAASKGLDNLTTHSADAEDLPFPDSSFDLLTCRIAFHHFVEQGKALDEFARVLKTGGVFGFTDNITVEDVDAAGYHNRFERVRDPSHYEVRSITDLEDMIARAGFRIRETRKLSKEIEFHDWADRQQVSHSDKQRLLEMMERKPPELQKLFQPRRTDRTMYFSLWEAVIIATLE